MASFATIDLREYADAGEFHGSEPAKALSTSTQEAAKALPAWTSYRHSRFGEQPSQALGVPVRRRGGGGLHGEVGQAGRRQGDPSLGSLRMGSWRLKGIPKHRGRSTTSQRLLRHVLMRRSWWLEGEKSSDAAGELFPSHIAVTSVGGCEIAPHLSDWSPLMRRDVVVWPDNDADGQRYAREVAALVIKAGASSALIVQLPEGLPDSWDLADSAP